MSATTNPGFVIVSTYIAFVFLSILFSTKSRSVVSTFLHVIPNSGSMLVNIVKVPP